MKANFTYQRVGDTKIDLAMQQVSQAFARVDQPDVMTVVQVNASTYAAIGNEDLIVANQTCKVTLPTPTRLWSVMIVQGAKANSVAVTTASASVALDGSIPGSVTLSEVASIVQIVTDGTAYYVVGSQAAPPPPPPPVPPGPPFGPPVGPPGPPSIPTGPAGGDLTGTYPNPLVGPNKVTYAKMQQVGAGALLGNPTGSLADVSEITLGNGLQFFFPAPGVQQLENSSALFMLSVSPPLSFDGVSVLASLFDGASLTLNGGNALQRAALAGDVTATAGSNATTIAAHAVTYGKIQAESPNTILGNPTISAASPSEILVGGGLDVTSGPTALERSALTGDATAAAGSNTTTVVAITESGGPTRLPIGAIPSSTPAQTVLVRPSGGGPSIIGVDVRSLAVPEAIRYFMSIASWPVSQGWIATSDFANFYAGAVESPVSHAAKTVTLVANLISNGLTTSGVTAAVTQNASTVVGAVFNMNTSTTPGVYTSGPITLSSSSSSDTFGIKWTNSATGSVKCAFTVFVN